MRGWRTSVPFFKGWQGSKPHHRTPIAGTEGAADTGDTDHWLAGVLLDMILWRNENATGRLAVGLPAVTTYRNLASRIGWFLAVTPFEFYWVDELGAVSAG
jgi:hypothetical protein